MPAAGTGLTNRQDFTVQAVAQQLLMNLMDQKAIETNWAQRGFSCGVWIDPPGRRWEDFVHSTDEVVMVIDGTVEFEVSGRIHHPQPGEELFIPAGAVHSVRNLGATTAHWLYGYRLD
jgi:mannose-6-phosphate isomerase-like protein (cupin superfamily)